MPRPCSVCSHSQRADIDKALVSGTTFRIVSKRFGITISSLQRHKESHLGEQIERAERQHAIVINREVRQREKRRDRQALDVMTEVGNIFERLNRMLDACDAWLADPDDPDVYDLNPRAHEVDVIYEIEVGEDYRGNPVRAKRKAKLSELLAKVEEGIETSQIISTKHKHADPRKLLVETASALRPSIELLAKLLGQIDARPQVNIFVTPEWTSVRAGLIAALRPYPEARQAVVQRLLALKAGDEA